MSEWRPTIRRGRPADARACLDLLWLSATDLGRRHNTPLTGTADDWWRSSGWIFEFLAEHAAEWWVADAEDGKGIVGYARSIERGGLFELTEFFVAPGHQSRGLGAALIARAFPDGRGDVRAIIATTEVRALGRYYRTGTAARFPSFTLIGTPASHADDEMPIEAVRADASDGAIATIVDIERSVLEFPRGAGEIGALLGAREGWLYRRDEAVVGFAFVGRSGAGPITALDPAHQPDILRHVETRAADLGVERLEFEVPGVNEVAMRHLLGRGFRIDDWFNLLLTSRPFGRFDRFIGLSPPVML